MPQLVKLIDPAVEPVALADVKDAARVTNAASDVFLTSLITAARLAAEQYLRRAIVCQTWEMRYDGLELLRAGMPTVLLLGYSPLIGVNSIVSYDRQGKGPITYPPSDYYVERLSTPGRVALANGAVWPTDLRDISALRISFTAGYGTPFTANATTSQLTFLGRAPVSGESLVLWAVGGALPTGLEENTAYFVISVNGNNCQFSLAAGGPAVTFSDNGSGSLFAGLRRWPSPIDSAIKMLCVHFYENRGDESVAAARLSSNLDVTGVLELPKTIKMLLSAEKAWRIH